MLLVWPTSKPPYRPVPFLYCWHQRKIITFFHSVVGSTTSIQLFLSVQIQTLFPVKSTISVFFSSPHATRIYVIFVYLIKKGYDVIVEGDADSSRREDLHDRIGIRA